MPVPPLRRQESEDSCVLACLRMILAQHGKDVPESVLAAQANKQTGGVDIEEVPRLAERHGLQADIVQLDIEAIADWVRQGVFPIVYLNRVYFGKNTRIDRKTALSSAIVHAVVPVRVSRRFITVHDPRDGKKMRVSRKTFEAAQRDLRHWCIICRPPA